MSHYDDFKRLQERGTEAQENRVATLHAALLQLLQSYAAVYCPITPDPNTWTIDETLAAFRHIERMLKDMGEVKLDGCLPEFGKGDFPRSRNFSPPSGGTEET